MLQFCCCCRCCCCCCCFLPHKDLSSNTTDSDNEVIIIIIIITIINIIIIITIITTIVIIMIITIDILAKKTPNANLCWHRLGSRGSISLLPSPFNKTKIVDTQLSYHEHAIYLSWQAVEHGRSGKIQLKVLWDTEPPSNHVQVHVSLTLIVPRESTSSLSAKPHGHFSRGGSSFSCVIKASSFLFRRLQSVWPNLTRLCLSVKYILMEFLLVSPFCSLFPERQHRKARPTENVLNQTRSSLKEPSRASQYKKKTKKAVDFSDTTRCPKVQAVTLHVQSCKRTGDPETVRRKPFAVGKRRCVCIPGEEYEPTAV